MKHAGLLDRTAGDKKGKQFQALVDLARVSGATMVDADKHLLNQLADNRPHQVPPPCPPCACCKVSHSAISMHILLMW